MEETMLGFGRRMSDIEASTMRRTCANVRSQRMLACHRFRCDLGGNQKHFKQMPRVAARAHSV